MHVSVEWDTGGKRKAVGGWQNEYSWTFDPNFSTIKKNLEPHMFTTDILDILHSVNFKFGNFVFFFS